MIVFTLQSVNPEEKINDGAVSVSIYSTRELALAAFVEEWENWNKNLGDDDDTFVDENFVPVCSVEETLDLEGSVEVLGTYYTLDEYEVDSGKIV